MSTENTATGYIMRYTIPLYLQSLFKDYLKIRQVPHQNVYFVTSALFIVMGTTAQHREYQNFLHECTRERRILYITSFKLDKTLEEAKLWGLSPLVEKKGLVFSRVSITAETIVLDRLEKFLSFKNLL